MRSLSSRSALDHLSAVIALVLLLPACGADALCKDAPLGNTCERVEGRWLIEAGTRDTRCGAHLFDSPLIIESAGDGFLAGWASSARLFGNLYPGGVFELFSSGYGFEVRGELFQSRDAPDELRGSAIFTEQHQRCDREWQFIGRRE